MLLKAERLRNVKRVTDTSDARMRRSWRRKQNGGKIMKKLLAVLLAVVLSLGLATVAFADVYGWVQMTNLTEDENATYHVKTGLGEKDTIKLWACFDGDWQWARFEFEDDGDADTDRVDDEILTYNGIPIEVEPTEKDIGNGYISLEYKITQNAQYVGGLVVRALIIAADSDDTVDDAQDDTQDDTSDDAQDDTSDDTQDDTSDDTQSSEGADGSVYYINGFEIGILPIDYVIAENRTVKGFFYIANNHALSTKYQFACNFEIELRNHYIDVDLHKAGRTHVDGAPIDGPHIWENASTYGYTAGWNDLMNVLNMNKPLILHRHYDDGNSSVQPSYVVYTEQFASITKPGAITFEYTGLATVKLAAPKYQTGINFKYAEGEVMFTYDELVLNPDIKGYGWNWLSKELLTSQAVTTLNAANARAALGYETTDKEQPAFLYYSADEGKTWTLISKVDLKGATGIEFTVEKDNVLGWYRILNAEYVGATTAPAKDGKDNVGTGASDMVSVCVALAVVSLVAAGAVCVKKVSK